MNMLYSLLLIVVIYLSTVSCISNTTYESMKMGISVFNKAGNDFFSLIRPKLDSSQIKIDNLTDFTLSYSEMRKSASIFLAYYILTVIGLAFACVMPFVGLVVCCCRCFGKCGARKNAMDPRNATCKKIVYGLIILALATAMLFGTVISLFNNQIVHEAVTNEDKSINVFVNLTSTLRALKKSLHEMEEATQNAPVTSVDNSKPMQELSMTLEDKTKAFYFGVTQVPEVLHFIEQTKSLKSVLVREGVADSQGFLLALNSRLTNLSNSLSILKSNIKTHLIVCVTPDCSVVKNKTERLQLSTVDQGIINRINATLGLLKSADFQEELAKIIGMKDNNVANMKLMLEEELKFIKDEITKKNFMDLQKRRMLSTIDVANKIEQYLEDNITSVLTEDNERSKPLRTWEFYRFYTYIAMCSFVLLIVICVYVGLLYGAIGERTTDSSGCCNRGVGAQFMAWAAAFIFISSLVMFIVVISMLTTGVAHTEMCRYTGLNDQNDAKVLDKYVDVIFKVLNLSAFHNGPFNGVFRCLSRQNLYTSFLSNTTQDIEPFLKRVDDKIVSLVLGQVNLTNYLATNPFETISSIDLNRLASSIVLLNNDAEVMEYLNELSRVNQQFPEDIAEMKTLNENVVRLKMTLRLIVQYLHNSENEYIRWKMIGQYFDNNKVAIIKSKSPELLLSVKQSIVQIIDATYNEIFKNVSCVNAAENIVRLFNTTCKDVIDPLNGTWYGMGFFFILTIPTLVFAYVLANLYRRLGKYYPDKDETDYDEYLGFYARDSSQNAKKGHANRKGGNRGYTPIPLKQM